MTIPREVVCIIMEHMGDPRDVLELASTCKTYRRLLYHVKVRGTIRAMQDNGMNIIKLLPHLEGL